MYFVSVVLLLLVFPVASIAVQMLWGHGAGDPVAMIGKWFVFWAVGVRLFIAGIRQVIQPQFTAESIFAVKDRAADAIVREIGFGNLAMGALGLASLEMPAWLVPAAVAGGLYYGLAGAGHVARGGTGLNSRTALISDLLMFVVLAAFVIVRGW
jgi:hypothetical protein